jgi:hypothetical protein
MGLRKIHHQEFKIKSTFTVEKIDQLMQIKCKWCNGFSKNNFKHKFYTTCNFWEEAPLPSL